MKVRVREARSGMARRISADQRPCQRSRVLGDLPYPGGRAVCGVCCRKTDIWLLFF